MTQIGQIARGKEIGYKGDSVRYIWGACEVCGLERWVQLLNGHPKSAKCRHCSGQLQLGQHHRRGAASHNWKGGRPRSIDGYVMVFLNPDDSFYPMANIRHYVFEHRLVMARHLGRCLYSREVVHHKNGIRGDNQLENLELTTRSSHSLQHGKGYRDGFQKGYIDGRDAGIRLRGDQAGLAFL